MADAAARAAAEEAIAAARDAARVAAEAAAAAPIPANFAGGYDFIADAGAAHTADATADSHALILQVLHLLTIGGESVVPAAARPRLEAIATAARRGLDTAKASKSREENTRQLRPITDIPGVEYGANVNVGAVRLNASMMYDASSEDTTAVFDWLTKVLNLARLHNLTFEATKSLLLQASGGSVTCFIQRLWNEGRTLSQIVQQLEMRYGGLCSPEEARSRCTTLQRKDGETLARFLDRLGKLAQMASSHLPDVEDRRRNKDIIVENNIRRVLPISVRNTLEERIVSRLRSGLPPLSVPDLEQECIELERKRNERKGDLKGSHKGSKRVMAAYEEVSTPEMSSEEEPADNGEDEEATFIINHVAAFRKKWTRDGKPFDQKKLYKAALGKWNDKRRPQGPNRYQGARQAAQGAGQGPPDEMVDRPAIGELLALAKVERGQCIQCGQPGHMMGRDGCALKGKPLKTQACTKCGKGLHSADDCIKAFQQANMAAEALNE